MRDSKPLTSSLATVGPDQGARTMSSREIAELTGSTHDSVLKTIRRLVAEGVVSANETPYSHPQNGQKYPQFTLDFRNTMVVVSGYSSELRARIIDRWQELEAGAAPALNLRQPGQMLAVAMQLAEICQEQAAQLTAQAPKVRFAEAVGAAENLQKIGEVAKALNTGSRRLWAFLREERILLPNDLPYQQHLEAGRFKVVEVPYRDGDGAQRIKLETRVTGKGVTFLQQRLAKQMEVAHG